jgi:hypothetical protein
MRVLIDFGIAIVIFIIFTVVIALIPIVIFIASGLVVFGICYLLAISLTMEKSDSTDISK